MKKYHYLSTVFLVGALGLTLSSTDAVADRHYDRYEYHRHHMHRGERVYITPAPIIHRRHADYCDRLVDRLGDLRDRRLRLLERVRRGYDSYYTHRHINDIQAEIRHIKRRLYEAGC